MEHGTGGLFLQDFWQMSGVLARDGEDVIKFGFDLSAKSTALAFCSEAD
jgi:hypothetical protein